MIHIKVKRILVAMDGSKTSFAALDNAVELARACHATILGVNVISFPPMEIMPSIVSYGNYQKKEVCKFLEKAKTIAARRGILFKHVIVFGNPVEEILRIIKTKKINMVVIGARSKGRISEVFLGSVSNAVIRKSKIPVLVVK